MRYILINGRQVTAEQAVITPDDRGFRYGDGLFETIPVYGALPYLWEYHLERLEAGLHALKITLDTQALLPQALALLKANDVSDGLLRIQVSRGRGGRGYLPTAGAPTLVMETMTRPEPPAKPLTLWLSAYEKISPKALPAHCKLAQGLNSTLARLEAQEHGCDEALQLGQGRVVAEAGAANIFWLRNKTLYTPSLDCGALAGVTRRRVMELSPYEVFEGRFDLAALKDADAVFLTQSTAGASAVGRLEPETNSWQSEALAEEFNHVRDKDINQYGGRLRESLARR